MIEPLSASKNPDHPSHDKPRAFQKLRRFRRHPLIAFDQHLAVRRHSRFGEAWRIGDLQLHADQSDLFIEQ